MVPLGAIVAWFLLALFAAAVLICCRPKKAKHLILTPQLPKEK